MRSRCSAAAWVPALALALAACAGPALAPRVYDLGAPPRASAGMEPPWAAPGVYAQVVAPAWLDAPAITYRLEYDDPQRLRIYAQSQWVDAPARLLAQRLRARWSLAAAPALGVADGSPGLALRIDLDEFDQVFESAHASFVQLQAQATLVELPGGRLRAQRSFMIRRPAPQADASGAVHGLAAAADEFADALGAWLKEQSENAGTSGHATPAAGAAR